MNWKQPKVYAVKHKDEATRAASRSGGIFTALSDQVLSIAIFKIKAHVRRSETSRNNQRQ